MEQHPDPDSDGDQPPDFEHHVASLIERLDRLLAEGPHRYTPAPGSGTLPPRQTDVQRTPATSFNPDHARPATGPAGFPKGRAAMARERIRQRRLRDQFFADDVFADPVWDMLLDLYAAHYEGQEVPVSSLCIAASVPATTALRWIKSMTDRGWLVRSRDVGDGRRVFLRLSDDARSRLDAWFDGTAQGPSSAR